MHRPDILAALKKCTGVYMPMPMQALDGTVTINLGAKGMIELELVSSGEKWHRGPKQDLHSSNEARVDSPAWHLVQALATLVGPDGHTPAIDGFAEKARPLNAEEKALIRDASKRQSEDLAKKQMGVEHWVHDVDWLESLELLAGRPTVNIEGISGGYTGPGGKTILPHRASGQAGSAHRAEHDGERIAGGGESALGQTRIRRYRSEYDRRLRSDYDAAKLGADPGASGGVPEKRNRSGVLAEAGGIVARLRVHGRSAESAGGTLRPGARKWRACAGRVLRHRIGESEGEGDRRCDPVASGVSLLSSGRLGEAWNSAVLGLMA